VPARRRTPALLLLVALQLGPLSLVRPVRAQSLWLLQFTPAEQLGGMLTRQDLDAPPLSPVALAEQGRQRNSDDPLTALPSVWRRQMRQVLPPRSRLAWQPARVLHSSWPRLDRPLLVPVVLYSDGRVDVFLDDPGAAPAGAATQQALTALLQRLDRPPQGTLQALLLELQPRPPSSPLQ
jgi:hypothetical protein